MLGREFAIAVQGTEFTRANLNLELSVTELATALAGHEVILNCTAYTAVDAAETNEEQANHVNGALAEKLAQAAATIGAKFIHFSTDYVFDGNPTNATPYSTQTARNPQNAYGRSKALGEALIEASGANYTIIRTAWLYGEHGKCFPKTIANLLESRGHLNIVADQHGQPTWTRDLVDYTLRFLESPLANSTTHLHGVASGQATWFDFAQEVAIAIGLDPTTTLSPVATAAFPTPAKRPAYSVLDNQNEGLTAIGDWRDRWHAAAATVLAARG